LIAFGIFGAALWLLLEFHEALGVALAVLIIIATIFFAARWRAQWLKRREYHQALLEFRWREDMSPTEFEDCCADYLKLVGWAASTTKGSGEQGVDMIARKNGHVVANASCMAS